MTSSRWSVRAALRGFTGGRRIVAAAATAVALSGCAAGMGGMMAGGGMHGGASHEAEPRVDERVYAPDRLLARVDALRLTAEQVVALQRLRSAVREDGLDAQVAARSAYDVLTASQRQSAERRDRPSAPASPSHRHD